MGIAIAVIIPALNEEATVADIVRRSSTSLARIADRTRVIVVDDGSTDGTARAAQEAGAHIVAHGTNRGVGRAFQTGLAEALRWGADILVNIDADGQFRPEDIPTLIDPILKGNADFATASRFKDPSLVPHMPRAKLWGNRVMSALISRIAGQTFHDVSCGFRAYNRDTALHLNLWGDFTYTQESILDLAIKGRRIKEIPLRIRGIRRVGESRVASSLWRYGTRAFHIIFHTYRDYWPLHFFGWLATPFLVVGSALGGFLLAHRFRSGAFSPHIWAGFTGGSLFLLGMLVLITGLLAEMLKRIRLNQEMILFYHRRNHYAQTSAPDPT